MNGAIKLNKLTHVEEGNGDISNGMKSNEMDIQNKFFNMYNIKKLCIRQYQLSKLLFLIILYKQKEIQKTLTYKAISYSI